MRIEFVFYNFTILNLIIDQMNFDVWGKNENFGNQTFHHHGAFAQGYKMGSHQIPNAQK